MASFIIICFCLFWPGLGWASALTGVCGSTEQRTDVRLRLEHLIRVNITERQTYLCW